MALSDWTFGDHILVSIITTNLAPDGAESSPYIQTTNTVGLTKKWIFPTAGTVNGASTKGFDEGQCSFWLKRKNTTAGMLVDFNFRLLDTLSSSSTTSIQNGYVLEIVSGTSAASLNRYTGGVLTALANYTTTYTNNVWTQHQISWWVVSGSLYIKYEIRADSGDAWTQLGSTIVDGTNSHTGATNQIAFRYGVNSFDNAFEGIVLKSRTS